MPLAVLLGGGGFIGSHLRTYLSQDVGWSVEVADLVAECGTHPMDVRRPIDPSFTAVPNLVVNLAAVHREPGHEPHEYWETNVDGALNVVRYCEDLGVTNLVFVSSISVYGPTEDALSESCTPTPTTDYGKSKLAAEEICREWRLGDPKVRRLTIVRPAVIFGKGEGGNFSRLGSALVRRRFVYPGRRDALKAGGYVKDLARSIVFAQEQPDLELIYNFANPITPTLQETVEAICRVAGRRPPRLSVSTKALMAAGWVGDAVGPIGRRLGLSRRRIEKLVSSTNIEPKVLQELGFEWEYDLESGLRDWYESEGKFE